MTLAKSHFRLGAAVRATGIPSFSDAALRRVERHFHVSQFRDPAGQITRIEKVFLDMQVAVGHVPRGKVLLADEPPNFAQGSFFFAAKGGYDLQRNTQVFQGVHLGSIYVCPRARTLNRDGFVYGLIHELGHYVGNADDMAYFHKDPSKYRHLSGEVAFRNADSYSQYAYDAVGKPDFDVKQNTQ